MCIVVDGYLHMRPSASQRSTELHLRVKCREKNYIWVPEGLSLCITCLLNSATKFHASHVVIFIFHIEIGFGVLSCSGTGLDGLVELLIKFVENWLY